MRHLESLDEIQRLVPEADPDVEAGLLEALCTTPDYPCLPVGEVAYQAQVVEDGGECCRSEAGMGGSGAGGL